MDHKQIKMLTNGPNGNRKPGDIVLVDEVRAEILVTAGHAEYFVAQAKTVESPKPKLKPQRKKVK